MNTRIELLSASTPTFFSSSGSVLVIAEV